MVCGVGLPTSRDKSQELEFSIDKKNVNAEIEESEGEEASGPDVDEELYVQLAGSKSEEEVDDEEMYRPALFPSEEGRKGGDGGGMDGDGW